MAYNVLPALRRAGLNELPIELKMINNLKTHKMNKSTQEMFMPEHKLTNEQKLTVSTSASLEQNGVLGAVSLPEPVLFLEWVSRENYWRLSKSAGHKWFKLNKTETYTTLELYQLFIKDIEKEIHPDYLQEYYKQLEYESSKLNTL